MIYRLKHEDILDNDLLFNFIYPNMKNNYYFSESFDEKFYIDLALRGFITIWHYEDDKEYLLPEIQFEYALLDFKDLHVSKKVHKLLKDSTKYSFFEDQYFEEIIKKLNCYHELCWVQKEYVLMLRRVLESKYKKDQFQLKTFGIVDNETGEIIAAELGYSTYSNSIYTSLSGFSSKHESYKNFGTLQMVLLGQYLENSGYSFWNLGHPYMEYKMKLGAKIYKREEFLNRLLEVQEQM